MKKRSTKRHSVREDCSQAEKQSQGMFWKVALEPEVDSRSVCVKDK